VTGRCLARRLPGCLPSDGPPSSARSMSIGWLAYARGWFTRATTHAGYSPEL
jgi:hypothetical protein